MKAMTFQTTPYHGCKRAAVEAFGRVLSGAPAKRVRTAGRFRPRSHLRVTGPRKSGKVTKEVRFDALPECCVLGKRRSCEDVKTSGRQKVRVHLMDKTSFLETLEKEINIETETKIDYKREAIVLKLLTTLSEASRSSSAETASSCSEASSAASTPPTSVPTSPETPPKKHPLPPGRRVSIVAQLSHSKFRKAARKLKVGTPLKLRAGKPAADKGISAPKKKSMDGYETDSEDGKANDTVEKSPKRKSGKKSGRTPRKGELRESDSEYEPEEEGTDTEEDVPSPKLKTPTRRPRSARTKTKDNELESPIVLKTRRKNASAEEDDKRPAKLKDTEDEKPSTPNTTRRRRPHASDSDSDYMDIDSSSESDTTPSGTLKRPRRGQLSEPFETPIRQRRSPKDNDPIDNPPTSPDDIILDSLPPSPNYTTTRRPRRTTPQTPSTPQSKHSQELESERGNTSPNMHHSSSPAFPSSPPATSTYPPTPPLTPLFGPSSPCFRRASTISPDTTPHLGRSRSNSASDQEVELEIATGLATLCNRLSTLLTLSTIRQRRGLFDPLNISRHAYREREEDVNGALITRSSPVSVREKEIFGKDSPVTARIAASNAVDCVVGILEELSMGGR